MSQKNFKGLYVESEQDRILRLYACLYKVSFSHILRNIINSWITDNKISENVLINKVTKQAVHEWQVKKVQQQARAKKITEIQFLYKNLKFDSVSDDLRVTLIEKYEAYKGAPIE